MAAIDGVLLAGAGLVIAAPIVAAFHRSFRSRSFLQFLAGVGQGWGVLLLIAIAATVGMGLWVEAEIEACRARDAATGYTQGLFCEDSGVAVAIPGVVAIVAAVEILVLGMLLGLIAPRGRG